LLIEDNPGDTRLIREMLAEIEPSDFEMEWADSLRGGLRRLSRGGIDVILLDLTLPDSRGFDTFTKAHSRASQVPIIVLTGLDDESVAVKAVAEGAQDYLVKSELSSSLLARSIRYALARRRAEEAEQLKRLSGMLINFQEEEKKRIARELHDELGQVLLAVKLSLGLMAKDCKRFEESARQELQKAIELVEKAMDDIHRISVSLRPEILDDFGLIPSVEDQIDFLKKRSGIKIKFASRNLKDRLEPEKEIAIFRVVQEALTNIIKHSKATHVEVSLEKRGNNVVLKIVDDGIGLKIPRSSKERGLGLLGMRERIALVGGVFKISAAPRRGTLIEAKIPV